MKKVVFFGNCQAGQLNKLMFKLIDSENFNFQYYPNNARTGGQKSLEETLSGIREADYLIYQPLTKFHGDLREENVLSNIKSSCIPLSFSYIFNSGICSLCNAPKAGKIFGSEFITEKIARQSKSEILLAYQEGNINFDLPNRFTQCLTEMSVRERKTALKLSDYIHDHYQSKKLFITHNHPANELLFESIRQIKELSGLPIKLDFFDIDVPNLPTTNCPVSPHDQAIHGYQFAPDDNWLEKGGLLISRIIDTKSAS